MTVKKKTLLFSAWCFVLFCIAVIFYFSHQTAELSSQTSNNLLKLIFERFGIQLNAYVIRKSAHAAEFGGLCLAFNIAYYFSFSKYAPFVSLASTVFCASADELHQYFVIGRACQVRDVFVDFCGAVLVTAVITVIYFLIKMLIKKERYKNVNRSSV